MKAWKSSHNLITSFVSLRNGIEFESSFHQICTSAKLFVVNTAKYHTNHNIPFSEHMYIILSKNVLRSQI